MSGGQNSDLAVDSQGPSWADDCDMCHGKGGQPAPSTYDPDRWVECPYCQEEER